MELPPQILIAILWNIAIPIHSPETMPSLTASMDIATHSTVAPFENIAIL